MAPEALTLFGSQLTPDEQIEIEFYPEIYFLGPDVKTFPESRRKVNGRINESFNKDNKNGNSRKVKVKQVLLALNKKC